MKRLVALELDPDAATRLADELAGANVTVQVGDATRSPFSDASFDSVGCFTMLHHIPTAQEQFKILYETFRVLRPGGVLVGADSLASQGLHEFHEGDTYNPIDPARLLVFLQAAGFDHVMVSAGEALLFTARKSPEERSCEMGSMTLPYQEPLVPREPGPRQIPEPPRRGEPGGPPCAICGGKTTSAVWSDDNWTLHPPVGGSLPGAVWLASRVHVDSFSDLPEELRADFGRVAARVERAILALGDIGRVHLYRWGDGGAHFHVWFLPRPLGMVEASGMALPVWEDVLPNVPDEELRAAAERVAERM